LDQLTLTKGFIARDEAVISQFYNLHRDAFLKFSYKRGVQKENALDVYQEAFIVLMEKASMGNLEMDKASLKTYLFAIGKYKIFELQRRHKKEHLSEDLKPLVEEPSSEFILKDDFVKSDGGLSNAFELLGEKCKELLTFFYYRGFTIEECVEAMGYKDYTVAKSQKSRCIKTLRSLCKKVEK